MCNKLSRKDLLLIILIIVETLIMFLFVFNPLIWSDEQFTVDLLQLSYKDVIKTAAHDSHPPLYYLGVKTWGDIWSWTGFNINCVSKAFSIIPFLILNIVSLTYIKKKIGVEYSILFSFMLFFMPKLTYTCIEARMYSWGILFVILTFIEGRKLINGEAKKESWIPFCVFGMMAAYTHYFACMAVIGIYVAVFIGIIKLKSFKNKFFNLIVCAIISAICYIPWLIIMFKQIGRKVDTGEYDFLPMNVKTVIGFGSSVLTLSCNDILDIIVLILNISCIVLVIIELKRINTNCSKYYLSSIFIVPSIILVGVACSLIAGHTLFGSRQLVFGSAILYGTIAMTIPLISNVKRKSFVVLVYIGIGILNGVLFILHEATEMISGKLGDFYYTFS